MSISEKKSILIISFKFPPMGGIGTRRWVKFAKLLASRGYIIHIITIEYPYEDTINWYKDIKNKKNIFVHRIKPSYPTWILKQKKSLPGKIITVLLRRILRYSFYYLDIAQRWGKYLIPFAKELIQKEKIRNVVVTAPPCTLLYTGSILKKILPSISLFLDYRDPWNNHRKYEYKTYIKFLWQKRKSIFMEQTALNIADKVIVVSEDMKKNLCELFKLKKEKVIVIYNGYDPLDFENLKEKTKNGLFNFIYTGELGNYRGARADTILLIAKAIFELNDEFINNNLTINIYSEHSSNYFMYSDYFSTIKRNFNFNGFVPYSSIPQLISEHSYCLSINPPADSHAFGTKIFDYMALKKKIFHISSGGELAEILAEKKQFVSDYNIDNIKRNLLLLKNDFQADKFISYDFSCFDINNLSVKIEELLI